MAHGAGDYCIHKDKVLIQTYSMDQTYTTTLSAMVSKDSMLALVITNRVILLPKPQVTNLHDIIVCDT